MGPHHRHVAGVVMRAILLLVGLIVFFIDHDEAKIGVGQKQRGARAHHDRCFAGRDRGPVALPRPRGQFGMPFQRPHPEAQREAVEKLAGQRYFRHQDQRLLAATDDLGDRLEIDLGLARTGDAIEQRDMKGAVGGERAHGIHRAVLLAREFGPPMVRIGRGRRQRRRHRLGRQRAFVDQAIDDGGADAGLPGRLGFAVQKAVGQHLDQPPSRRCQPLRRFADQPHAQPDTFRAELLAHPQAHPQHHAARRQRVVGDPVDQRAQFRLQRRHIDLLADLLETIVQPRIGIGVVRPDHGDHLARTERHGNDVAGLQLYAARHPVGISLVKRDRHQHIDHAGRCGGRRAGCGGVIHRRIGFAVRGAAA